MRFETVYYSRFWYSRFAHLAKDEVSTRFFEDALECHRRSFRLLALFFENIYMPRTHLLPRAL
jgi:hypothetical protein